MESGRSVYTGRYGGDAARIREMDGGRIGRDDDNNRGGFQCKNGGRGRRNRDKGIEGRKRKQRRKEKEKKVKGQENKQSRKDTDRFHK